jgi:hypothetical protein
MPVMLALKEMPVLLVLLVLVAPQDHRVFLVL